MIKIFKVKMNENQKRMIFKITFRQFATQIQYQVGIINSSFDEEKIDNAKKEVKKLVSKFNKELKSI